MIFENPHREDIEKDLERLLFEYAQLSELDRRYKTKAYELLQGIKHTFSKYKTYMDIFGFEEAKNVRVD